MTTTILSAFLGLGVGAGLLLVAAGWRHTPRASRAGWSGIAAVAPDQRSVLRLAAAAGVAVLAAVITAWVVGGLLAGLAAWVLPQVLGRNRDHERRVARIEAVAGWAEMLRDTLAAAAGLEQAIVVTAPIAPAPIRAEVTALAARLEAGRRLSPSLRGLADELDNPSGDLVVAALIQASERQARQLGELLSTLAQAARDQVGMRLRVEANRARTRTSTRVIVGTTLAFAAGLVLLNRDYLSAYNDAAGQLVLLAVGGLFAVGFGWLARIARISEPPRLITTDAVLDSTDPSLAGPTHDGAVGS